ncbi:MAG: class I SAM-dependent methyltransferase [Spirochaetia bacterium]|nr:class I SAM-dependent methyltransferase [Spirochaetia bacterium]
MEWNPGLCDHKHGFVSKYGEDVVNLLAPQKGENILDAGCGIGNLTNLISGSGADVIGIDNSEEMIKKAHKKYLQLKLAIKSVDNLGYENKFDAVFFKCNTSLGTGKRKSSKIHLCQSESWWKIRLGIRRKGKCQQYNFGIENFPKKTQGP